MRCKEGRMAFLMFSGAVAVLVLANKSTTTNAFSLLPPTTRRLTTLPFLAAKPGDAEAEDALIESVEKTTFSEDDTEPTMSDEEEEEDPLWVRILGDDDDSLSTITEEEDDDEKTDPEEKDEPVADEVTFAEPPAAAAAVAAAASTTETDGGDGEAKNILFLQSLGAITNRGEFATPAQKEAAAKVVAALEEAVPADADNVNTVLGTWELVLSNTQLFRASPFFLAGRATCTTPDQAKQYDWFCEMHRKALAISQVRAVRQIVASDTLTSEFEVEAGSVPFVSSYSGGLPVTITGALVSTASLTYLSATEWELYMDTVEVKGSNLPLFRQLLDSPRVKLPTRDLSDAIQRVFSSYEAPKPSLRTTYCSDQFRISRDQDDNIFVYVKTSDSTEPTDYSSSDSDLGLVGLLEGFNDAVTKIFI